MSKAIVTMGNSWCWCGRMLVTKPRWRTNRGLLHSLLYYYICSKFSKIKSFWKKNCKNYLLSVHSFSSSTSKLTFLRKAKMLFAFIPSQLHALVSSKLIIYNKGFIYVNKFWYLFFNYLTPFGVVFSPRAKNRVFIPK